MTGVLKPIFNPKIQYGRPGPLAVWLAPASGALTDGRDTAVGTAQSIWPFLTINTGIGYDVAYQGGVLFTTAQTLGRLYAYDVSDPANISELGFVGGLRTPRGLGVSGSYAFVSEFGDVRVRSVNVSNPSAMTLANQTGSTTSGPQDLEISGNYAFTGTDISAELVCISIASPASPSIVGSLNYSGVGDAQGVAVYGNLAFVSTLNSDKVIAVDITNPASPSALSEVAVNQANQIFYDPATQHVFVVYDVVGTPKIRAIDASNPSALSLSSTITPPGFNGNGVIRGSTLFMGHSDGLYRIDISDPGSMTYQQDSGLGIFSTLAANGDYIYSVGGGRVAIRYWKA